MTKEDLNVLEQYNELKQESENLKKRLEKIENQSAIVSDVVQNGYRRHAVIRGVDLNRLSKIDRLEEKLREKQESLLDLIDKADEIIDKLPRKIKRIAEYRYIDCMTWVQIQVEMRL